MKKLIDKIKSLPLPVNLIGVTIILWAYPFIEAAMIGATGWGNIPIHSLILLGIGGLFFLYAAIIFFFIPVGRWIGMGVKWVINRFKKTN